MKSLGLILFIAFLSGCGVKSLEEDVTAKLDSVETKEDNRFDEESVPVYVKFNTVSELVSEGVTSVDVNVRLSKISNGGSASVDYTVTGTASDSGVDYTLEDGTVSFSGIGTSENIALTIVDDSSIEADETIVITLSNPVNCILDEEKDVYTYTIRDNDNTISFASATESSTENGGNQTLTLSLDGNAAQDATVEYTVTDGSATNGTDYTLSSGTLTFVTGESSKILTVTITDDGVYEGSSDETFSVVLSNPSSLVLGGINSMVYSIVDDENQPEINFSSAAESVNEDVDTFNFTVELSNPSTETVVINYGVDGGSSTATSGTDYTMEALVGTLTFDPLDTSETVAVTVIDDGDAESNETIINILSSPTNGTLGSTDTTTYTIVDNDIPPNPANITTADGGAAEPFGLYTITVELDNPSTGENTIDLQFNSSSSVAEEDDFNIDGEAASATVTTLTFADTEDSKTISVSVLNDSTDEDSEDLIFELANPSAGISVGTTKTSHTYAIGVDGTDIPPEVTVTSMGQDVQESVGIAYVMVSLSEKSGKEVIINYGDKGTGSATSGDDYSPFSGALTFAAHTTTITQNIAVLIADDTDTESDETVVLELTSTNGNATIPSAQEHTITILGNDQEVSFSSASSNGNEEVTAVNIPITLSSAMIGSGTVDYTISGTALDGGVDYTVVTGADNTYNSGTNIGTFTFNNGEQNKNISLTINDETLFENDETIILTLSNPSSALKLGSTLTHTYTVDNTDMAPTIQFQVASSNITEEAVVHNVVIELSTVSGRDTSVGFTSMGENPNPATGGGVDYTLPSSPLTLTEGNTTVDVAITIVEDTAYELDEAFSLGFGTVDGASILGNTTHVVTINEDADTAPEISFNASSSNSSEGAGTANLAVDLTNLSYQEVTIEFSQTGGTAQNPADFSFSTSSPLTFSPGESSKNIVLSLAADSLFEVGETAEVTLANPGNATLNGAASLHTFTIIDDDASEKPEINFSSTSREDEESAGTVTMEVTLDKQSGIETLVNVSVNGSSTATEGGGADFTFSPSVITFAELDISENITVTINNDTDIEGNEDLILDIATADSNVATLGASSSFTETISDDDNKVFFNAITNGAESLSNAVIQVDLMANSIGESTVDYVLATPAGTATQGAGADYTFSSGTLTFANGENSKDFTVTVNEDTTDEENQTIILELVNPSGVGLNSSPEKHTYTIDDNDPPPNVSFASASANYEEASGTNSSLNVVLSEASEKEVTVEVQAGGGTATGGGGDYTFTTTTLTFAPGETSKPVTVTIVDERIEEVGGETFTFSFGTISNATATAPLTHVATIIDDPIPSGLGFFEATETTLGTNINQSEASLEWSEKGIDATYFSVSGSNNERLEVETAGDYFFSVNVPLFEPVANNVRAAPILNVYLNGALVAEGISQSTYFKNNADHQESSAHLAFILPSLSANNYLEVRLQNGASTTATIEISGRATVYMEYLSTASELFHSRSDASIDDSNLNNTSAFDLLWDNVLLGSDYGHTDGDAEVTFNTAGDYLVYFNLPLYNNNTQRLNLHTEILYNSLLTTGGVAAQGLLRGNNSIYGSSEHWFGLVRNVTGGNPLKITTLREANAATMDIPAGRKGALSMRKINTGSNVLALQTTSLVGPLSDWNQATATSLLWNTPDIIDSSVYSVSGHEITVNEGGDYLMHYTDAFQSAVSRANIKITVLVDSVAESGAEVKSHYIRNSGGHSESSGTMVYLLRDVPSGAVIEMQSQREANTGSVTAQAPATLMLWKK